MVKVVSVINYKGGVGKTTLTANLATSLALEGKKVLIIDLDPQANLTFSFISVEEWAANYQDNKTLRNLFKSFMDRENLPKMSSLLAVPNIVNSCFKTGGELHLLCSHLGLIDIDIDLASNLGGGSSRQQIESFLSVYSILKKSIQELLKETERAYDLIIIDCPPNLGVVTKNAIVASDYYIIPAKPDYLSTLGINELVKHINELKEDYNENVNKSVNSYESILPTLAGILFNMISTRKGNDIGVIEAQRPYVENIYKLKYPVFNSMISDGKSVYASAPENGIPVCVKSSQKYKDELYNLMLEFSRKVGME